MKEAKLALQSIAKMVGVDAKNVIGKIDEANALAWSTNKKHKRLGHVNCALAARRAKADDRRHGFLPVGVSKLRGPIGVALSPFHLQTPSDMMCFATRDGLAGGKQLPARSLELVWQAAKVKHSELSDGLPDAPYFKRRAQIYDKGEVKRSYIPKHEIAGAVFGWSSSPAVAWVPSRKFYCVAYNSAARQTPAFRFLEAARADGWNLLLGGPDGHPIGTVGEAGQGSPSAVDIDTAYLSTRSPFGHERVLVAMFLGHTPWSQYRTLWPEVAAAAAEE